MVATSYTGGQIAPGTVAVTLDISPNFFLPKYIFYIHHLAGEKSLGSKFHFIPLKDAVTFGEVVAVLGLRCSCRV